ncbi:hypothetical protein Ocin01_07990 [Orchesella cincta]|uniref:O-acyltransferase WSD1 C-terminal domain-containing protein n=1 Tax=Orchesella cincta TaxID=48709 RepID=A0A1D2N084_ORCCI|nr:hypothetical protein Ocin01_07990 [Orchesella cincta]
MTVAKLNTGSSDPKPKQTPPRRRSLTADAFSPRNLCKKLIRVIFVLIAFVVYGILVPIFLICMLPVYMYRGIVVILQKIFHPEWAGIMCSRDALVGLDNTTKRSECMIMAILIFRGVPDVKKCTEHIQKKVMEAKNTRGEYLYRKFTYYYENWLGFPFWKKEADFKLEKHFRQFDYKIKTKPTGANGVEESVTEDELLRYMGEIEALPFPKGQSPWEIMILPNYIPREGDLHKDYAVPEMTVTDWNDPNGNVENGKYFALVFRIHHAIGDGYSCMKMLMCHICNEPLDTVPKAPIRHYNIFTRIVQYIAILVLTPYYHFNQFFVEIDSSLWHLSTNQLAKKSHFVSTERIPLESLKQVGKAHKVPMTGVFLAGLAGGIHNFLKLSGKGHQIPKFMRAFSPMPWEDHPAFTTNGLVNHWTVGVFGIPVSQDTPHKRLRACKKSMNRLINSPILVSNFWTVPILLSAPNFMTSFWGTNWMTSMILSNFPGPKDTPTGFDGKHQLDNLFTFVPHMRGSAGLGIMFPTCMGNARCTVSVDTAILKDYSDAQFLVSLIDEEFRILRTLHSPHAENRV